MLNFCDFTVFRVRFFVWLTIVTLLAAPPSGVLRAAILSESLLNDILRCSAICVPAVHQETSTGGGADPNKQPPPCVDKVISFAYGNCKSPPGTKSENTCLEKANFVTEGVIDYEWVESWNFSAECITALIAGILLAGAGGGGCGLICGATLGAGCYLCVVTLLGNDVLDSLAITQLCVQKECKQVDGKIKVVSAGPHCK